MEPDKDGANARAAIYTRVSKDVTNERLAVTSQLKDCLALAKRKGWRVLDEKFEDNDTTAAGGKDRKDYLRLKALMEAGGVDDVVVYSADRLHRKYYGYARTVKPSTPTRRKNGASAPVPAAATIT